MPYMAAERLGSCAPFSPVIEDERFAGLGDALAEITSPPFAVRVCDMHDPYSLLITKAQADQSGTKKITHSLVGFLLDTYLNLAGMAVSCGPGACLALATAAVCPFGH